MKKIFLYIPIILALLLATSCKKKADASKDVVNAVNKLNYFNKTFTDLYSDGEISKVEDEDKNSEFKDLRTIASEYYEMMNKINTNIEDEKEDLAKGKSIDDYEKKYKEALEANSEELNKATKLFEENLSKME